MTKIATSEQWSLNGRDFVRGLIAAVIAAVLPVFAEAIDSIATGGTFSLSWNAVLSAAAFGGLSYLGLNLGSPSKVIIPTGKSKMETIKKKVSDAL